MRHASLLAFSFALTLPAQEPAARSEPAASQPATAATEAPYEGWPYRAEMVARAPWRQLGPANMGGRITDIDVHPDHPYTWYVASAGGGLFKTANAGTTWTKLFQDQPTVSIGDVAIAPSNPDVVWLGSGEENARNSVQWGDGIYKSTDAGRTWTNMGLRDSFQIGHIAIHPTNPDVVFVAALGRLWGANEERGVFRTNDGGKSWQKVLYVDDRTGCIDVRIDAHEPNTVYAAMYHRERDLFCSNDPSVRFSATSGLYRSDDGGGNWKKLTGGLPTCKWGRTGLAMHGAKAGVVYAIIETERNGWASGTEERAAAGAAPQQRLRGLFQQLGIDGSDAEAAAGGRLDEVRDESPAANAGLKEGDVVVRVSTVAVTKWDHVADAIVKHAGDEKAEIVVKRDGKELTLNFPMPAKDVVERMNQQRSGATMGIQGEDDPAGALLTTVTANGPAAQAGLKENDVVTQVGETKVTTYQDLTTAIGAARGGEKATITYRRGGETGTVEITWGTREGGGPGGGGQNRLMGGQLANQQSQGDHAYETGGIFRSNDRGETWTRLNSLTERPFYYSVIAVDPQDDNNIYSVGVSFWQSTNGGRRFTAVQRTIHVDFHAIWIDPHDSNHIVAGCDGGLNVTFDKCKNWEVLNNFCAGQYYHACADNAVPYNVYGGLQDNGTWRTPSRTRFNEGITTADAVQFYGGDGFGVAADPEDSNVVFATSQGGAIGRVNMQTGARGSVQKPRGTYRWNWDSPFFLSPHNPRVLYFAGNVAFRAWNRGERSEAISPSLSRTERGSATAFAESPMKPGIFYLGTDDGALWRSKDGGKTWDDIQKNTGLPGPRYVSCLHPSHHREGRVYASFDGHRSDDHRARVLVSEDYGDTWKSLDANLPDQPVHVCRDLPESAFGRNDNLLVLGTEFGCYASLDRGGHWFPLGAGLPTVAVRDLFLQNREHDLIAATHGQGIWAIDLSWFRQMTRSVVDKTAHLFVPEPCVQWRTESRNLMGHKDWKVPNPPAGTAVYLYLQREPEKDPEITIHDVTGKQVASVTGKKLAGVQVVQWNGRAGNRPLPAGSYSARCTLGELKLVQPLAIENDPQPTDETLAPSRN